MHSTDSPATDLMLALDQSLREAVAQGLSVTPFQVLDVYYEGSVLDSNESCSAFAAAHAGGDAIVAVDVEIAEDHSIPKVSFLRRHSREVAVLLIAAISVYRSRTQKLMCPLVLSELRRPDIRCSLRRPCRCSRRYDVRAQLHLKVLEAVARDLGELEEALAPLLLPLRLLLF